MWNLLADHPIEPVSGASERSALHFKRAILGLAWVVFAVVIVLTAFHHEPWRDEADVWLAARDMTLGQIFPWLHYAGTPGLWHVLVMIPAKLGWPFQTMELMHALLAIIVAGIILCRAPFSWWVRCLLVFSYYTAYEYAIIARSYVLTELFLVLIATCYAKRFQRPLLMGLWLALLANTSVHGGLLAGIFFVAIAGEYILRRRRRDWESIAVCRSGWRLWAGMLLAVAGGLLAAAQVFPAPPDGGLVTYLTLRNSWAVPFVLARTYLPRVPFEFSTLLDLFRGHAWPAGIVYYGVRVAGALAFAATIYLLRRDRRMLFVFLSSLAGMMYVFLFKWMGDERHTGLVWLMALTCLWIAWDHRNSHSWTPRPGWLDGAGASFLVVTLIGSIFVGAAYIVMDWRWAYSGAPETARFLIDHHLVNQRIAAFTDAKGESLLPYMPGQRFWYVGVQEYGTYMQWRRGWEDEIQLSLDVVLERVARKFNDDKTLYLILNQPLAEPDAAGYRLIFHDHRRQMPNARGEHYYVYLRTHAPLGAGAP